MINSKNTLGFDVLSVLRFLIACQTLCLIVSEEEVVYSGPHKHFQFNKITNLFRRMSS